MYSVITGLVLEDLHYTIIKINDKKSRDIS